MTSPKPRIELHFNGREWWARMFYSIGEQPWCYWPHMLTASPGELVIELRRYALTELGNGESRG